MLAQIPSDPVNTHTHTHTHIHTPSSKRRTTTETQPVGMQRNLPVDFLSDCGGGIGRQGRAACGASLGNNPGCGLSVRQAEARTHLEFTLMIIWN